MTHEKYVVFKAEDWQEAFDNRGGDQYDPPSQMEILWTQALKPETYGVIRTHDVFARTTFGAYFDALSTAKEILEDQGFDVPEGLKEAQQWAFEMKVQADRTIVARHLPTP